jgi:hypothetical protein
MRYFLPFAAVRTLKVAQSVTSLCTQGSYRQEQHRTHEDIKFQHRESGIFSYSVAFYAGISDLVHKRDILPSLASCVTPKTEFCELVHDIPGHESHRGEFFWHLRCMPALCFMFLHVPGNLLPFYGSAASHVVHVIRARRHTDICWLQPRKNAARCRLVEHPLPGLHIDGHSNHALAHHQLPIC